jgi:hypothetical protein
LNTWLTFTSALRPKLEQFLVGANTVVEVPPDAPITRFSKWIAPWPQCHVDAFCPEIRNLTYRLNSVVDALIG